MAEKETEIDKTDLASISVVTENEKQLARTSYQDFFQGRYIECIQSLLKLVTSRPNDPKVMHNKAVVEYYLSDFKRSDEFKKNLQHVCNQTNVNLDDVESLDDVEHCILYYNYTVILYHLRQYHTALTVLDKVFQFIEPLEENLARKVCFLLLELYLCTYQPEKALGMINFIEGMLFETHSGDNKAQATEKDADEKDSNTGMIQISADRDMGDNEACQTKLQQYKVRCYLMLRSLKGCKRELKNLLNSSGSQGMATVYLKANVEFMKGSYRKAIKVLNTAPAQIRPFVETGENASLLFYNNMGCIHFYMGRPNLGCHYFQKALHENEQVIKRLTKADQGISGRPIYTIGANYRYELLYNLGLQLLHAKKPEQAFDCLIEAVQVYQNNPRLWLRLAECCIQYNQHDNEADFRLKERKKDMIQGIIGGGPHRKIILSPYTNKPYDISEVANLTGNLTPTLEAAAIFLRNAMALLPEDILSSQGSSKSGDDADNSQTAESNLLIGAAPGNPIKGTEIASLRCSILAASAYVALNLGDILMALHYSETLLAHPRLSGIHRFLGHLYAGEALLYLDRIVDAIQQWNPTNIKDLPFTLTLSEREDKSTIDATNIHSVAGTRGWFPNSLSVAHMVMQYNLTVAYTVRDELHKASDTLKQLNHAKGQGMDIPIQAMMLALYIQMQLGHADVAKTMIRQNFPQYR